MLVLHRVCCCVVTLACIMARVSGDRAPPFTAGELDKLVDGVLPLYAKLYGRPAVQVSAHQKKGHWQAIAKEVRTLGVYNRRSTHCRKRWEDLRRWARKTLEAQLDQSSQRGRGARREVTPLMLRILAVAYPELHGRWMSAQQTQGASSGEGAVAPASGDAEAHGSQEAESSDAKGTSGSEGAGSTTGEASTTGGSDSEASSDGSPLGVVSPSGPSQFVPSSATPHSISALPVAPHPVARARPPRRMGVSFAPGTSAPAPVSPAALTEEAIDLLRTISVGQTTILNAIQGLATLMQQNNAFLEGIHGGVSGLQRSFQALASSVTAACSPGHSVPPPTTPASSSTPVPSPVPSTRTDSHAHTPTPKKNSDKHKQHTSRHRQAHDQHTHADTTTSTSPSVSSPSTSRSVTPTRKRPRTAPSTTVAGPIPAVTTTSAIQTCTPCTTPALTTTTIISTCSTLTRHADTHTTSIYTGSLSSPTVSTPPPPITHKRALASTQQASTPRQHTAQSPASTSHRPTPHPTTPSASTPRPPSSSTPIAPKKLFLSRLDLFEPTGPPRLVPKRAHLLALSTPPTSKSAPVRPSHSRAPSPVPRRTRAASRPKVAPPPPKAAPKPPPPPPKGKGMSRGRGRRSPPPPPPLPPPAPVP